MSKGWATKKTPTEGARASASVRAAGRQRRRLQASALPRHNSASRKSCFVGFQMRTEHQRRAVDFKTP